VTLVVSVLLACAVAFGVFLVFQGLSSPQVNLLEARLAQFGDHDMTLEQFEMTLPFFERVLRPFAERIGGLITSKTPAKQTEALQDKLTLAGRPFGMTVGTYLTTQIVAAVAFLAFGFGLVQVLGLTGNLAFAAPIGGAVFGYIMPRIWLDRKVKKRKKEMLLALPNALDLLTISVEAGLSFDAAIARVCEKYHNALSEEFAQVLNEVRLGRPRLEALDDMGKRNHVEELQNFIQAIVQSEQLGVGIANVLRIQSEEIRRRRRQRAEEQGQKAPLKMLFPMVGCIFPTLFICLLGPAVLQVIKSFGA
jgi:tight adherence protein C